MRNHFGAVRKNQVHNAQGISLHFFYMRELSIFVDESGDFDIKSKHSPYYVYTLVFHDQSKSIKKEMSILNEKMLGIGYKDHAIHSEPLISSESPYQNDDWGPRRRLFYSLVLFARSTPIEYQSFCYKKQNFIDKNALVAMMARDLSAFIRDNMNFFIKYDKIKVYYDNGQEEISKVLNISLNSFLQNVEINRVQPKNYKLFQVADLICTIELLDIKYKTKSLSKSETRFFDLKVLKTYIKTIKAKHI